MVLLILFFPSSYIYVLTEEIAMIIFGTTGINFKVGNGQFNCPNCGIECKFKKKKRVRFFALYFIPLIPYQNEGNFIECQRCKNRFIPQTTDFAIEKQVHEEVDYQLFYEKSIRHCMVLVLLANQTKISQQEWSETLAVINKYSHHDMTMYDLKKYTSGVRDFPEPVETYLKKIAPSLDEHGKELFINSALNIARANGRISEAQTQLIYEMSVVMDMDTSRFVHVLNENSTPK